MLLVDLGSCSDTIIPAAAREQDSIMCDSSIDIFVLIMRLRVAIDIIAMSYLFCTRLVVLIDSFRLFQVNYRLFKQVCLYCDVCCCLRVRALLLRLSIDCTLVPSLTTSHVASSCFLLHRLTSVDRSNNLSVGFLHGFLMDKAARTDKNLLSLSINFAQLSASRF